MDKKPIVVITGPTCTGKTALAVRLSKELGGEIVSADALQVYRGIEIIAASPTDFEKKEAVFHLVGIKDLNEEYSVRDFVFDAEKAIEDIYARGKIPIVCGGTGLYINSLINGIDFSAESFDENVRKKLEDEVKSVGTSALYERLKAVDPLSAEWIHPNNRVRLIRAMEVIETTGMKFSDYRKKAAETERKYDPLVFLLNYSNRQDLYDRINERVDMMREQGMEEEARKAINACPSKTVMNAIGLHEFTEDGTDVYEKIKQDTRNYCKRQLTWWRKTEDKTEIFVDRFESEKDLTLFCISKIKEHFYD